MKYDNDTKMKEVEVNCYNCNHSFVILCKSEEDEECIQMKKEYCEKCAEEKHK